METSNKLATAACSFEFKKKAKHFKCVVLALWLKKSEFILKVRYCILASRSTGIFSILVFKLAHSVSVLCKARWDLQTDKYIFRVRNDPGVTCCSC